MITYNRKDFNLPEIEEINGEFNLFRTEYLYYIYGLKQEDNPPILFTQNYNARPSHIDLNKIGDWLKAQGIDCGCEEPGYDEDSTRRVYIGLRKDVRSNLAFSAALIKTFVGFFEGALELTPGFKLPKITFKKSSWRPPERNDTDTSGYYYGNLNYLST